MVGPVHKAIRESHIERTVCVWAKNDGWLIFKFSSPSLRGVPDRMFIKDGLIVFIEFKAPSKKPTPLQAATMAKMGRYGAKVAWFDNADDAIGWLRDLGTGRC
jgi:hypothetical protein